MYNKLFTKILDSSIWLAPDPHRLVWITLIAAMDEDGNAMFASAGNLAARARVTREQAEDAIRAFESPDPDSGDPDHEGRRIERFPGGWHLLNAHKYRDMVTKAIIREQTRIRTANYREKMKVGDAVVTHEKRTSDESVTPSRSRALSESEARADNTRASRKPAARAVGVSDLVDLGVRQEHAADWIKARGKVPLTATALARIEREADKAGMTLPAVVKHCAEMGWRGFEAEWMTAPKKSPIGKQKALEDHNRAVGRAWAAKQGVDRESL